MARIPIYERTESMAAPMNVARATTAVSPNSPVAQAMGSLAQAGMQAAVMINRNQAIEAREAEQKAEEAAAVQASNVLSDADFTWMKRTSELFDGYDPKAGGDLPGTIAKEFDEWSAKQVEAMPTEKSRAYFSTHAAKMKATLQGEAFTHQEKAKKALVAADTAVAMGNDEQVVYSDPSKFEETFTRRVDPMIATSKDHAKTKLEVEQYRARLSLAKERGEIKKDPAEWYRKNFGALPGEVGAVAQGAGFDAVMGQIFKTEGGYSASDGNTGAPVNFGINQKANPDIDVKNLTKDEAAKIYKARYWDKINGDSLPPALQGTAMDAAVNQGPENAKKWISESGGDPAKFNALRRAHYEKLLESPDNAPYRKAWMGRLAKYENGTASAGVELTSKATPAKSKTLLALPFEVQEQLEKQALSEIKQKSAEEFSGVAVSSARETVSSIDLPPDTELDIPKLKAEAVAKAEAAIGKITEQQRLSVENAVEAAAADKERDRKRAEETDVQAGFDALDKNGGDIVAYQRDNQAVLARMGRVAKERLNKYAGEVSTGQTRTTDWPAYTALVENPAALKTANLAAVRDKFNATEFGQLVKMQEKLTKEVGAEDNIRTNMTIVKEMLKTASVTDDKKEAKFFSMLQQAIDQELLATGKKALKQSEVKALADDLLVKTITSRGVLWDSSERSFNIDVPQGERLKIEAALTANGLPATDYEIMRQYRKKLEAKSVLQKKEPAKN